MYAFGSCCCVLRFALLWMNFFEYFFAVVYVVECFFFLHLFLVFVSFYLRKYFVEFFHRCVNVWLNSCTFFFLVALRIRPVIECTLHISLRIKTKKKKKRNKRRWRQKHTTKLCNSNTWRCAAHTRMEQGKRSRRDRSKWSAKKNVENKSTNKSTIVWSLFYILERATSTTYTAQTFRARIVHVTHYVAHR